MQWDCELTVHWSCMTPNVTFYKNFRSLIASNTLMCIVVFIPLIHEGCLHQALSAVQCTVSSVITTKHRDLSFNLSHAENSRSYHLSNLCGMPITIKPRVLTHKDYNHFTHHQCVKYLLFNYPICTN